MSDADIQLPVVFRDEQMVEARMCGFAGGRVGVYSSRCPGKTTANEDAAAIVPFDETSGALVVADGMGAHAEGEVAAQTAIDELVTAIGEARQTGTLLRTGIINGFERANHAVQRLASGAGTTLAVVELGGGLARPYHAGDSIVLIVGLRGKIKLETTSHSPVGFGVEAGLLEADEAMDHEHRHLVLNAVGDESMRIEIGSAVKLAKRDTLLVASDGLTDNLTMAEIVRFVRKGPLQPSLTRLVSACQARMNAEDGPSKPDDLTVVAFRPAG
jgi:serine/threonine protein phosphatase PrpC